MNLFQQKIKNSESGQMMLMVIVILTAISLMLGSLLMYTAAQVISSRNAVYKEQGLNIADAAIEKAIWNLNQNFGYAGETNTSFGGGAFDVGVTVIDSHTKQIMATSYVPSKEKPSVTRTVSAQASISSNIVAFNYGVQSGNGGFLMSGSQTKVNGNVYSNGNIVSTIITGSAVAANLPEVVTDQENSSPSTPAYDISFGQSTGTQDFAQSFKISQSYSFNNIELYIKKTGSPSDETVRILYDNSGSPGDPVLGLNGMLDASKVTSNYGWVTVSLPVSPVLTAGQTYWMVIDGTSNASKYYTIGANDDGYANGVSKIGKYGGTWNSNSPLNADAYFKIYLGGETSSITGGTIGIAGDDVAWAHTVNSATVSGTIYCKVGTGNNKSCDTSSADPDPQALPLSDGNIQDFKSEALVGGTIEGDVSILSDTIIGPVKINGNLSIGGGSELKMTGTIWVTGNITLSGGAIVRLDSSYGSNDGAIISDGYNTLTGGSEFYGSGEQNSYPFFITTSSCPDDENCASKNAISFGGGSGTVGLVAQNGTISITGGSALKAVTAKTISMSGGAELFYDSGLVNSSFSSGPGGGFGFVQGTYLIIK